jgi:hypothetical protein
MKGQIRSGKPLLRMWLSRRRLRQWEEDYGIREPIECIFEEGDFEQGKFTLLMVDEGQFPPIYKTKNEFAGL